MEDKHKITYSLQETAQYIRNKLGSHLATIELSQVVVGLFYTGVRLSTGHAGVAFTPRNDIPEAVCCPRSAARMPESGRLCGKKVAEVLPFAWDSNILKAAIGVATVNALSHYLWDKLGLEGYNLVPDKDALEEIDFTQSQSITLVGAFIPFIRQLKVMNKDFIVLEKDPQTLKGDEQRYFRPQSEAEQLLAKSDTVILTGATMVNHTIDYLLSLIPANAQVIIAGPTASMVPKAFFQRGGKLFGGDKDHSRREGYANLSRRWFRISLV
jgi:uncharacterized protein (DUF4213/DUF364 family)